MADPKEWGPTLWKILHIVSEQLGKNTNLVIQNDEMTYFKAFQRKVYFILPCKICRDNLKKNLLKIPLTMDVFKKICILYGCDYSH